MPDVYVSAGSNVQPEANLRSALSALKRRVGDMRLSHAYQNKPAGFAGPDFINLVIGFETELTLTEVLSVLQAVEGLCGRPRRSPKFEPRTMDLDLLLYGDMVCNTHAITLPRPDLATRAYMLRPLAELAPDRVHPTLKKTMSELWAEFDQASHPMTEVTL